jgi:hypothetical protein
MGGKRTLVTTRIEANLVVVIAKFGHADHSIQDIPSPKPIERRRSRRIEVLLQVEVETGGARRLGRLTEISRAGGRIELRGPKSIGDPVTVRRGGVELKGQIVWWEGAVAGLWFPKPMDEESFIQLRKRTVG